MHRDGQDIIALIKYALGSIAVVHVNVQNGRVQSGV